MRSDAGSITGDSGGLPLRETDRRLNLSAVEMVAQRLDGPAPGYEDVHGHERHHLRPLLLVPAGNTGMDEPLAGNDDPAELAPISRDSGTPRL